MEQLISTNITKNSQYLANPIINQKIKPAILLKSKKPHSKKRQTPEQIYLRELMEKNGYTVTQLAKQLQISKATVSRLANGVIKKSSNKLFAKLISLYCAVCYGK